MTPSWIRRLWNSVPQDPYTKQFNLDYNYWYLMTSLGHSRLILDLRLLGSMKYYTKQERSDQWLALTQHCQLGHAIVCLVVSLLLYCFYYYSYAYKTLFFIIFIHNRNNHQQKKDYLFVVYILQQRTIIIYYGITLLFYYYYI